MRTVCLLPTTLIGLALAGPLTAAESSRLAGLEQIYADFNDAQGAVAYLDSGSLAQDRYAGRSRQEWQQVYVADRTRLLAGLKTVAVPGAARDRRALSVMRAAVQESPPAPESLAPVGRCSETRAVQSLRRLQQSLYACFSELGNQLSFEGGTVTRVAAFELLTRLPEPERRRALFMAFVPLWRALNGSGEANSPYRRMILRAAAQARRRGSAVTAAAQTLGVSAQEVERWLERVLRTWADVAPAEPVEPWDYRFAAGPAERELAEAVPREALRGLNQRFYEDLGLNLAGAQVVYDLEPRAGKAPLAYTDYIRRGRMEAGTWQPTLVRVSASYERGGLGPLNELVHENGHAAHMLALRTRPAFMDLGDALFYEAFADVPAWSVYEAAWQQKYLGRHSDPAAALRAHHSAVMLDVAWALFDCRMLDRPGADPNQVWTDITSRYLHVIPHPELPWWAMRVQLVDEPGYMVNYGLGAVITADLRRRIQEQIGSFDAGNPRWFVWLQAQLLGSGEEYPTSQLLRRFLGRPVSTAALLEQLRRDALPPEAAGL
ncbi:MAG: hypothetical protein JOZ03_08500 [Gammaproteobacteria bacterium]|nr:hypothetical protein [Gammaproteobacteria bacterium]